MAYGIFMILLFLFHVCQSLRVFPGCLNISVPLFMVYLHYELFILLFFQPTEPQTKNRMQTETKKKYKTFSKSRT